MAARRNFPIAFDLRQIRQTRDIATNFLFVFPPIRKEKKKGGKKVQPGEQTFFFRHMSQALAILLRFGSPPPLPSSEDACPALKTTAGTVVELPRNFGDGAGPVGDGVVMSWVPFVSFAGVFFFFFLSFFFFFYQKGSEIWASNRKRGRCAEFESLRVPSVVIKGDSTLALQSSCIEKRTYRPRRTLRGVSRPGDNPGSCSLFGGGRLKTNAG